jgi:hypothetical protein
MNGDGTQPASSQVSAAPPATIWYQAKGAKPWREMMPMNHG